MSTLPELNWLDDANFTIDGTSFTVYNFFGSSKAAEERNQDSTVYWIAKPRWRIDAYVETLRQLQPRNILEVGVFMGGACVFLDVLCRPERLAAIELKEGPLPLLSGYIKQHERQEAVKIYRGVDQSDGVAVPAILDEAFGDESIDLVIDDASHLLNQTRSTFNMVFPRMRPGGLYVIEDWTWAHQNISNNEHVDGMFPDEVPLTVLAYELLLVLASTDDLIADLRFDKNSIFVTRGEEPLPDRRMDVSSLYHERGRRLLPTFDT